MGKSFRDKIKVNSRGGWLDSHGGNRLLKGKEEDWDNNLDTILGGNQRFERVKGSGGNINYNVVRRWLKAQVGRPWNDVKRQMILDTKSMSAHIIHNFRHTIDYLVEEKATITAEDVLDSNGRRVKGLYVDAEGILKFCPRKKYVGTQKTEIENLYISQELELTKVNGIWYQIDKRPVVSSVNTIMTSRGVIEISQPLYSTTHWEEYQRKTLSSKELKKYGLVNEPKDEMENKQDYRYAG